MEKISEFWSTIKQLLTSRTIWGVIVMLAGGLGIELPADLGGALVNAGDQVMVALGAVLALIGYVDRRPKPGMIEVKR